MDKKGAVWTGMSAAGIIGGLILLIIAFTAAAEVLPDVATASAAINATGLPLASFFAAGGIVLLALMAGLLMAVLKIFGIGKGSR